MLRLLILFVMSWIQSVIERNAETKKLHPTRLTQVSISHRYFWEGGQARFPALSSSHQSTYSRWGSYRALAAASEWVRIRPAAIAILEPHENHEWRNGLVGNGLYHRDIAFAQRVALHSAKCADTEGCPDDLYDEAFQNLHGRSNFNRVHKHDHCVCR